MHCGYAPFYDDNNFTTYEKILAAKIDWPKYIDPVARDLMKKLLVPDRFKRLGSMKVSTVVLKIQGSLYRKLDLVALFHFCPYTFLPEWSR